MQQQHILVKIGRGARNAPYHLLAEDGVNPLCGVAHEGENYVARLMKTAGERRCCRACQRAKEGVAPWRCATCGSKPARKANIAGRAEWRCAYHEQEARIQEQRDIEEAIAKGNTWLLKRTATEQTSLFDLMEGV